MDVWSEWAETFAPFHLIVELEAAQLEYKKCFAGCQEKLFRAASVAKVFLELRFEITLLMKQLLQSCVSEDCAAALDKEFSRVYLLEQISYAVNTLSVGMVLFIFHFVALIFIFFFFFSSSSNLDPIIPILSIIAYLICAVSCVVVFVFGAWKKLIKVQPSTSAIFFLIFGLLLLRVGLWSAVINFFFVKQTAPTSRVTGVPEVLLSAFGVLVQACFISCLFVFLLNWVSAMESLDEWSEKMTKGVRAVAIACWCGTVIAAIVLFSLMLRVFSSGDYAPFSLPLTGPAYFAFAVLMLILVVILLGFTSIGLKSLKKNSSKSDDGLAFRSLYQMIIVFVVVGFAAMLMCVVAVVTVAFSGSFSSLVTPQKSVIENPVPVWFREFVGKIVPEVIISLSLLYYVAQAWVSAAKVQSSQRGSNFVEMNEPLILNEEEQGKIPSAYDL
jgi:hypothetical protein